MPAPPPSVSSATRSNSATTLPSPDPGNRSSMRPCSALTVSMILSDSSWRNLALDGFIRRDQRSLLPPIEQQRLRQLIAGGRLKRLIPKGAIFQHHLAQQADGWGAVAQHQIGRAHV